MTCLLYSVPDAAEQLGIGRSTLYELVAAGDIKTVKIGRRVLVTHDELERYIRSISQ